MILSDRFVLTFRTLCIVALLIGAVCYVVFTIHWPWMWDTQVMHYIALLLRHGKVPYRDIYDINMPGAYLTEIWAISVFGGGDIGWRLYEYILLATMTMAMVTIAKPRDWLAGLFAGVLYSLHIGSLGPAMATERDEVMTVLMFVGYALAFAAVRKAKPWFMLPAGLALGIATLIKPTVLLFIFGLLLFVLWALIKRSMALIHYMAFALAGLAIAFGILLGFLLPHDAFSSFLFNLRNNVPFYSSLVHPSLRILLRQSLTPSFLVYLPLAILLAIAARARADWEMWAVRAAFVFGLVSYFVQHKGYEYHRISSICFGLMWIGMEFTAALKDTGWRRAVGVAGMAFGALLMVPRETRNLTRQHFDNSGVVALQQDLNQLGGDKLQGKVQCLDLVDGCLSALYRLDLVQSTGFVGDLAFFGPDDGKVVPYYRKILWDDFHNNAPQVVILTNEWYQGPADSFDKLNSWPEFRDYLNSAYRLDVTRGPYRLNGPTYYRIYVLKQSVAHTKPSTTPNI